VLRNMRGGFDVVRPNEIVDILGAELKEVDANLQRRLGIRSGLQVVKLKDGKLKEQGVKEGFIITRVNRTNVSTAEELYQMLSTLSGGVLVEGVYPNGLVAYYAIGL